MNKLNYASLEKSKELVDNGIILETDVYWYYKLFPEGRGEWILSLEKTVIPAPSFNDIWSKLPESTYCLKGKNGVIVWKGDTEIFTNTNSVDALIDLLILYVRL